MASKGSDSLIDAANEYFDALVKSRFNELIQVDAYTYQLGQLIEPYSTERCDTGNYPILSITKDEGIVFQNEKFKKRIASLDVTGYKIVPHGKLVQGIHIDERNFAVQDITDIGIVSPAYKVYTINADIVEPKIIEYYLRSDPAHSYICSKFRGSIKRRESITQDDLLKMPVTVPSKTIQSNIVCFMNQVDKSKLIFQQMVSRYDELVKSRFIEMFDQYFDSNEIILAELCISIDSGKSFNCGDSRSGDEPAILKLGALLDGVYNSDENKMMDPSLFRKELEVKAGDVLFSRKNTYELVGTAAYVWDTPPNLMLPDLIFRINLKNTINPIYFVNLINHPQFRKRITSLAHGAAASMPNISKKELLNLRIPLPPIELQNQFADFVKQVDKSKSEILDGLKKLRIRSS